MSEITKERLIEACKEMFDQACEGHDVDCEIILEILESVGLVVQSPFIPDMRINMDGDYEDVEEGDMVYMWKGDKS